MVSRGLGLLVDHDLERDLVATLPVAAPVRQRNRRVGRVVQRRVVRPGIACTARPTTRPVSQLVQAEMPTETQRSRDVLRVREMSREMVVCCGSSPMPMCVSGCSIISFTPSIESLTKLKNGVKRSAHHSPAGSGRSAGREQAQPSRASALCAGGCFCGEEAWGQAALTAGAVRAQEVVVHHLERAEAHLARDGRDRLLLARLVRDPRGAAQVGILPVLHRTAAASLRPRRESREGGGER